jgi:cytochrome b561
MGISGKSTSTTYGTVAVTIHWISALLIIGLLGSGLRAASTIDPEFKAQILGFHALTGITIVVLTLARIAWWWMADKKPDPVTGTPAWQHACARVVHLLFYVVILGMGASGIGMLVSSGAGQIIFGGGDGQLPNFWDYRPRMPHGIGARVMIALLAMHILAALYHHVIRRDGLLRRMWYGSA